MLISTRKVANQPSKINQAVNWLTSISLLLPANQMLPKRTYEQSSHGGKDGVPDYVHLLTKTNLTTAVI